jgi:hypothetical protein
MHSETSSVGLTVSPCVGGAWSWTCRARLDVELPVGKGSADIWVGRWAKLQGFCVGRGLKLQLCN